MLALRAARRVAVPVRAFSAAPLEKVIFTAHGEADVGTREGRVKSFGEHHGNIDLKLEKHPAHGGKGGGTNPEELLAMGWAACFNGALRLCADKNGIKIGDSTVKAAVSLGVVGTMETADKNGIKIGDSTVKA